MPIITSRRLPTASNSPDEDGFLKEKPPLAVGGFAVIHRAFDRARNNALVIHKELRPEMQSNPELQARFWREIQLLLYIKGRTKRCVEIDRYAQPAIGRRLPDRFWFTMSTIATRGTLSEHIERNQFSSPELAAVLCLEVIEALASCHAIGVVHRDVKPRNILVMENYELRLADFGMAKVRDEGGREKFGEITECMDRLGTPGFMAPEAITGVKGVGAQYDLFSVGCVLWCLLMGKQHPVFDGTRVVPLSLVMHGPLHREVRLLDLIVQRAVRGDLDTRYRSAQEMADDLRSFLDGGDLHYETRNLPDWRS